MQITAKFASTCGNCRQPIALGSKVEWTPGSKASHVECPTAAQEDPRAFAHLRSAWDNDDASYESWLMHQAGGQVHPVDCGCSTCLRMESYRQDADDEAYNAWMFHVETTAMNMASRPLPGSRIDGTFRPAARLTVEDKGVYVMPDGQIVRMQANREGTAVYPKLWTVISGIRLTEADTREHGEFRYIEDWQERKATSQRVSAEGRKMSLEEALAFAVRYGQCARCSRHLKDATSVERGLGPICVQYFSSEAATEEVAA